MEPEEITVIVYSADNLIVRKKGRSKFSAVFGIGHHKYKTDVVNEPSGHPEWNEESTIKVEKGEHPLIVTVREKDDILGQISVPLNSLPNEKLKRIQKIPLGPHKKCQNPSGTLTYEAWVSKLKPIPAILVTGEEKSSKQNALDVLKGIVPKSPRFARKSPLIGRKSPLLGKSPLLKRKSHDEEPGENDGRKLEAEDDTLNKNHDQTESLSQGKKHINTCDELSVDRGLNSDLLRNRRNSRSLQDLSTIQNGTEKNMLEGKSKKKEKSPGSLGLMLAKSTGIGMMFGMTTEGMGGTKIRSNSFLDLASDGTAADTEDGKPCIKSIMPTDGPVTGGTKVTIRGRNLGECMADVVGLFLCGSNILGSLEFESSSVLHCVTKPWKPGKGFVVVETQSGGKGTSLVQFWFYDPDDKKCPDPIKTSTSPNEHHPEKKGGLFSLFSDAKESRRERKETDRDSGIEESSRAELLDEIKRLKAERKALREANESMKLYIDNLVAKVMEDCPECLNSNLRSHKSATF